MKLLKLAPSLGALGLWAGAVHARVVISVGESENYEIPRSQMKTYIQKGSLQGNLKAIKSVKPGALSDEELVSVPEKYLPPELVQRQRAIKSRMKGGALAGQKPTVRKQEVVTIQPRNRKSFQVKIDEAVWVPTQGNAESTILAPQKRLPDVEMIQELRVSGSEKIRVELKPGEVREIFEIFENGRTKDREKVDLLPAYVVYRERDYASAVTLALGVAADARASNDTKILGRYVAAHALFQAGFYGSALPLLTMVITSKWRRSALGIAAQVIEKTRDDGAANQILAKLSLSQIPDEYRPLFSFHLGRILLNTGAGAAALAAFDRVPSGHRRYPEAQYYMGVVKASELGSNIGEKEWDREGSAVYETRLHFDQALHVSRSADAGDLHNLASLSLARLAYQAKQYNQAVYYYQAVEANSPFARESMFENAWALYRLGEFNRSLGALHPLGTSYFESRDLPELWILRSLNYLKLCRFDEAQRAANTFENDARQSVPLLNNSRSQISRLHFDRVSDFSNTELLPWVKNIFLNDPVINKDMTSEAILREEQSRLAVLKNNPRVPDAEIRYSVFEALSAQLDKKIAAIAGALRPYITGRLDEILGEYRSQRERLDFLRFEIYSQANRFPGALERPEAKKLLAKKEFLPGVFTKGHEILWRYTGEFWLDELRGYDYFIPSECKSLAD